MADLLGTKGKIAGMTGIQSAITGIRLEETGTASFSAVTVSGTAFTVNSSTGALTNDNAIVFTIEVDDIGRVGSQVSFIDTNSQILMTIDLDSTLTITHAGEATIPVGELSATL